MIRFKSFDIAACLLAISLPVALGHGADTITPESWGERVGFAPDAALPVPAGTRIGKANVDKVRGMIPQGLERLVRNYALELTIKEYEPIRPSRGYIAATNANRGTTKLVDVGKDYRKAGMTGWRGGLPFPRPASGLEVASNFLCAYSGDDSERFYDVFWLSGRSGVEHNEYWRWATLRGVGRTDIEPKPEIEALAKKRVAGAATSFVIEPYDKKGFGALFFRSLDPIDLQGHTYVPSMRRFLRTSLGTRGDAWNATDFLYEDVNGYLGAAEWMNWKLVGKKTLLMPMHGGVKYGKSTKQNFDFDAWPHWNPKLAWEPRPVYVLEVTPKLADYPYSRMLILVDAESFTIPYKEAYDKKGELWKIILIAPKESPDPDTKPMELGVALAIDLQAEHATAVAARSAHSNLGLEPAQFTVESLRRAAR